MADTLFFKNNGPFSLQDLAEKVSCKLQEKSSDADFQPQDVSSLEKAGASDISFLDNVKYKDDLKNTKAGAVVLHPKMAEFAPEGCRILLSETPYSAYAKIAALFYPESISGGIVAQQQGLEPENVHSTASVASTATIGKGCLIGANCVIEDNVTLGDQCVIEANTVITKGCIIGDEGHIGSNCSIGYAVIGKNVRIHNGARIGQDGFGFALAESGFIPVPQLGRVVIGEHCNIGANTTIDRGSGPDTKIGDGCIIDNLVQIAHNVDIGRGCIIVAQVGISGSSKIGNYCVIAGQAGVVGHLEIGDGCRVGAQAGVTKSLDAGAEVIGSPAQDKISFWRELATLRRIVSKKKTK